GDPGCLQDFRFANAALLLDPNQQIVHRLRDAYLIRGPQPLVFAERFAKPASALRAVAALLRRDLLDGRPFGTRKVDGSAINHGRTPSPPRPPAAVPCITSVMP